MDEKFCRLEPIRACLRIDTGVIVAPETEIVMQGPVLSVTPVSNQQRGHSPLPKPGLLDQGRCVFRVRHSRFKVSTCRLFSESLIIKIIAEQSLQNSDFLTYANCRPNVRS